MKRRLRWLLVLVMLTVLLAWVDSEWNLRSNLLLFLIQDTQQDLLLQSSAGEWESVFSLKTEEIAKQLTLEFDDEKLQSYRLPVERASDDNLTAFVNFLLPSHLRILEFSPQAFQFEAAFMPDFALSSATEIQAKHQFDFAINANYFDENNRPLGRIVHQGEQLNPHFPNWTGYFFVKNGQPHFGPRSLLEEIPGKTQELLQCYPSLMKDHEVFNYVHLKANPYFDGNSKTYRSLAGMRANGNVVFILSGSGGILDVRELATLAQKLGLQHATLFDGGSSLQYRLQYKGHELDFEATSSRFDISWLIGSLKKVRPPVFIGVKAN